MNIFSGWDVDGLDTAFSKQLADLVCDGMQI